MEVVLTIVAAAALIISIMAFTKKSQKVEAAAPAPVQAAVEPKKVDLGEIGRVNAVIALALNQYLEDVHDYENTILTIQKIVRPYSPWSSKIYGLRQVPQVSKARK